MKRYLITGASRGIGRAIAEKLSASDVVLLLHGRDTVALAEVCESAKTQCAQVVPLIHDLALPSGVSKLIAEVGSGSIDLLVNNAGIADRVGANYRRQHRSAILVDAVFRSENETGLKHRQYSFDCGENRVSKLERLLHEQVRSRRLFAGCAGGTARA